MRDLLLAVSPGSILTSTPVTHLAVTADRVTVTANGTDYTSDYAVLAIPQPAWGTISFAPAIPATYQIATGPAVKYLSPVTDRFWLEDGLAPYSLSNGVGVTWEGTDNQMVVAGEHTVMAMFGYMEGALESGLLAADRIVAAAGVA